MRCNNCGEKLKVGYSFCTKCGTKQPIGKLKDALQEQVLIKSCSKFKITWLELLIFVILLFALILFNNKESVIVGSWMCGTDKITFTSDGSVNNSDGWFGTYTIDEDNILIIDWSDGFRSNYEEREFNTIGKEDSEYWYISNRKLYLYGREYKKK